MTNDEPEPTIPCIGWDFHHLHQCLDAIEQAPARELNLVELEVAAGRIRTILDRLWNPPEQRQHRTVQ